MYINYFLYIKILLGINSDNKSYVNIPEKNILQFIQNNIITCLASTQAWVGKIRCVIIIVADLQSFPFYVGIKGRKVAFV